MKPESCQLLDLIENKTIFAESLSEMGRKINCCSGEVHNLFRGKRESLFYRYVNPINKKTFVLINYDTEQEFECVSAKTFCLHFSIPYDQKIGYLIYQLKSRRTGCVSLLGNVFYLKGNRPEKIFPRKSNTPAFKKQRQERLKRRGIQKLLQVRINTVLASFGAKKVARTEELIGCSFDFFISFLESKFEKGMTWKNRGSEYLKGQRSWHVDHIIPCNTFDLTKPEEQKRCFHYTNLRPLWEKENLARPKDGSDIQFRDEALFP